MHHESLEGRTYCVKTQTAFDPTYHFAVDAIRKVAGDNVRTIAAVAGPADRTYVLAGWFTDPRADPYQGRPMIAVAAVRPDGSLDPAYGTQGVALTGRYPLDGVNGEFPELLRVDGAGRAYVADNTRVLRLKSNGTTDKHFGDGGQVRFASAAHGVSLGDLAPTDDGVLVATTSTKRGVQRFAVQAIDTAGVRTVWSAEHDTGNRKANFDGNRVVEVYDAEVDDPTLSDTAFRFARSRSGLVLAHVEDATNGKVAGGSRLNTVVVTRFDAADRGSDLSRTELRRNPRFGDTGPDLDSVQLSPSGRVVTVASDITGLDVLQVDVRTGKVHRHDKPDLFGQEVQQTFAAPDGYVYALGYGNIDANKVFYKEIARYAADGTQDKSFGDYDGVATIRSSEFADPQESIQELFADSSGRVYVYAANGTAPSTLTLARL